MKKIMNKPKSHKPILRFSPTAWAKLIFMCDMTDNEVGGFGITQLDDLLFVTDFAIVKQKVTCVSVAFDDNAVGDFFEEQVQSGKKPQEFARIWLHTHPGNSPLPSSTDEATFERVFGSCDWSVMAIIAQDDSSYARLRFNAGPGGDIKIPVWIDYSYPFDASEFELWKIQYMANVEQEPLLKFEQPKLSAFDHNVSDNLLEQNSNVFECVSSEDLLCEIEKMDPIERQSLMDELAIRSDFWDKEMEVFYE